MQTTLTTTSLSLQEITEALALFGLTVEDNPQSARYDVKSPSLIQPGRSTYRLVRVDYATLAKLANATAKHQPTKNRNGLARIQSEIIKTVMKEKPRVTLLKGARQERQVA